MLLYVIVSASVRANTRYSHLLAQWIHAYLCTYSILSNLRIVYNVIKLFYTVVNVKFVIQNIFWLHSIRQGSASAQCTSVDNDASGNTSDDINMLSPSTSSSVTLSTTITVPSSDHLPDVKTDDNVDIQDSTDCSWTCSCGYEHEQDSAGSEAGDLYCLRH